MTIDATRDVDVSGSVLASFPLDQPDIPLQRVVDAGPPSGLFVANARSFFVVQTAGLYAFSLKLTRSGAQSADCLARMVTARHQMLRDITLNTDGSAVLTYATTHFRLDPGLLLIVVAAGCWRGDRVMGAGDMTLMVRKPGELELQPALAEDIVRPAN